VLLVSPDFIVLKLHFAWIIGHGCEFVLSLVHRIFFPLRKQQ